MEAGVEGSLRSYCSDLCSAEDNAISGYWSYRVTEAEREREREEKVDIREKIDETRCLRKCERNCYVQSLKYTNY